ncbi:hypothetical protein C0993_000459 [Termitomyces sp. T159_Od127]|nr:hypothetical protein C0993_000459 [Termitomyces sp. T159_Od127]
MSAQFVLLTAFSNSLTGGNPAAVVFTDLTQPDKTLQDIAQNLNQPITAFVSDQPLSRSFDRPLRSVAFSVRWYTTNRTEVPLCGHGTLAAAKAIFERPDVAQDTEVVELHTLARGVITAVRRPGGLIQIEMPATETQQVSSEEFTRISKILNEASGRELKIELIATGGEGFETYTVFVLDEKEDIKNLPINPTVLVRQFVNDLTTRETHVPAQSQRQAGFQVNIYTTVSSNTEERFVSRMFAPGFISGDEDHVCGSAHCLMAPYWYRRLGIDTTSEIKAKQVSARGGDLTISWDSKKNRITLAGEVVVLGNGEMKLAREPSRRGNNQRSHL